MTKKTKDILANSKVLISLFILTVFAVFATITFTKSNQQFVVSKPHALDSNCTLTYSIPTPTPFKCNQNVDVVGVTIDRSNTMNTLETDGRTKLTWAKEAVNTLIQTLERNQITSVKISINSFGAQGNYSQGASGTGLLASPGYDSLVHTALTNNYTTLKSAVDSVRYINQGTCISCGLRLSNQQSTPNNTNKKIAILLSDGMANRNWDGSTTNAKANAINEANLGRNQGISYYVIGYGSSGSIDETTLKSIAGSTSNYQYKPNAADWSNAFLSIITNVCQ